jgi:exopolyphosphatase/guanosine-5'-triphosphate,3'-diphosphate pyrophosphatase
MTLADGKVLYKTLETTRLGEGIAQTPVLKKEAIERTALAVFAFYKKAKTEGAKSVYAFATAAVRSAENGDAFVKRVKELCPLAVDVVSGEREAELGILGALTGDGAVLDIGGASTELVVKEEGKIVYKKSLDIGVVRLKDACGDRIELLEETCKNFAAKFSDAPVKNAVAIGGTATTIGAVAAGLKEYSSEKVTGVKISANKMRELSKTLLSMPVEEIEKIPCVLKNRADIIGGGVTLLSAIMQELELLEVTISDADNLEGYAKTLNLL